MLHVLRMPSLMICSILLGILFFYDIFFVFITPLFTRNGKSVMVEVATGGETGEQLPMVLKVNLKCTNEKSILETGQFFFIQSWLLLSVTQSPHIV